MCCRNPNNVPCLGTISDVHPSVRSNFALPPPCSAECSKLHFLPDPLLKWSYPCTVVYSPCWPPTTGTSRHIGLAAPVRAVHLSSFFIHLRWLETIFCESMQERSLYLLVLLLKCTTILSFTKHYGTPLSIWTSIIWIMQLHHKSNYGAPKWILGLHNLILYFANTDKSIVFTCPSA